MNRALPFTRLDEFLLKEVLQETPGTIAVRAYQPSLERPVFLKLLKPHLQEHTRWVERFQREARICARLKHPNIVDVYTIGEQDGYTYMAMEFVEGLSLRELLEKTGPLPLPVALEVVHQVLMGLEPVHQQGIIHRDVKPGNILLRVDGTVKLTDFGLAYLGEDSSLTQPGSILGTPAYMSPEQITGEPLTPATDLFALGATLYEMVTGIKPFAGENYSACIQKILNEDPPPPSRYNKELPRTFDELIAWLIAKNSEERPHTVREVMNRLEKFPEFSPGQHREELSQLVRRHIRPSEEPDVQEIPATSPKEEPETEPELRSVRKWPVPVALLLLVILFTVVILGYLGRHMKPFRSPAGMDTGAHPRNQPEIAVEDSLKNPESIQKDTVAETITGKEQETPAVSAPRQVPKSVPKRFGTSFSASRPSGNRPAGKKKVSASETPAPAEPARLVLNIAPWATLSVDGNTVDSLVQHKTLKLPPGTHQIMLTHPRFPPKIFRLSLNAGEQRQIEYSFLKQAGFLMVEVRPWAEVFVDGKHQDTTPLRFPIILPPGQHLLELKNPYYAPVRKIVQITPGDTLMVREILNRP